MSLDGVSLSLVADDTVARAGVKVPVAPAPASPFIAEAEEADVELEVVLEVEDDLMFTCIGF
jgi:hypothetical protein